MNWCLLRWYQILVGTKYLSLLILVIHSWKQYPFFQMFVSIQSLLVQAYRLLIFKYLVSAHSWSESNV